jgi:PadR family transcriptional regulator, regulatory protein PadR
MLGGSTHRQTPITQFVLDPSAISEVKPARLHTLRFYGSCSILYIEARGITMPAPKSDLPQGTLDLLLLKVVALGQVHGYAIAQRLEQISRGVVRVPEGSLYPALHRLENRGLLTADWKETETGREAKFYRLTGKGRKQLETEAASWQRLIDAIALILVMPDGGAR